LSVIIQILIAIIALEHLYFFWLESFAWTSKGPKVFSHLSPDLFLKTKAMMANQGLYNSFLAAGLLWSLFIEDPNWSCYISMFFLGCVSIAGLVGAFTVSKKIFWIQAFPALISLLLLLMVR
jgi:putative membrane protein